jgi:hypothetical protein
MICPKCKSKTNVIESRKVDGVTYRKRVCLNKHRSITVESFTDSWPYRDIRVNRKKHYKKKKVIRNQVDENGKPIWLQRIEEKINQ